MFFDYICKFVFGNKVRFIDFEVVVNFDFVYGKFF